MMRNVVFYLALPFKLTIICFIKFYKYFISAVLPNACRFQPTCSEFALSAINTHGIAKGIGYIVIRILKCNPFCNGGFDPVPNKKGKLTCQTNRD